MFKSTSYFARHFIVAVSVFLLSYCNVYASNPFLWRGNTSSDWFDASNWLSGTVPDNTNTSNLTVTIGTGGAFQPVLTADVQVPGIVMNSGSTIDLGGHTFTATSGTASSSFTNASVFNGTLNITGSTVTFSGSMIDAAVTVNCSDIFLSGTTFRQAINITKTGANDDYSSGGNVFNANTTINNIGGLGLLVLEVALPDTFNAPTFVTCNSGYITLGSNNAAIFNGDLQFSNNSGFIECGLSTVFNGNIILNNTNSIGALNLSGQLANGKTISSGNSGYSAQLDLQFFTQLGTTAQTLNLGNTSVLLIIQSV